MLHVSAGIFALVGAEEVSSIICGNSSFLMEIQAFLGSFHSLTLHTLQLHRLHTVWGCKRMILNFNGKSILGLSNYGVQCLFDLSCVLCVAFLLRITQGTNCRLFGVVDASKTPAEQTGE